MRTHCKLFSVWNVVPNKSYRLLAFQIEAVYGGKDFNEEESFSTCTYESTTLTSSRIMMEGLAISSIAMLRRRRSPPLRNLACVC